jgi:ATP-dependent exoDNAse (exonuclease V) beta subunit
MACASRGKASATRNLRLSSSGAADCNRVFTPQIAKGKTFPLAVILDALMRYSQAYRGDTRERVAVHIKERFGLRISPRTLSQWLAEYRELTTYARLRLALLHAFRPHQLIRSTRLHHQQVYHYRIHQGKLASLLNTPEHQGFQPIETYLMEMAASCPHPLFQQEHRASASASAFDLTDVEITEKQNLAPHIAGLILQTVTHNKRRHDTLQRFILATDSVTVAIEVPVFLTPDDIDHLQRELGFTIPFSSEATLTGHIDLLQIRNGAIHILDYKPNAVREKPITQLMVYALALSRRTGLRLYDFVCAWFDERHYFEFYPLHVVHKRQR